MKKKILSILITILVLCTCLFTLTACAKDVKFKLKFVVDNEIYATIDTSGAEIIQMPENPTKEDYNFEGWFWDKDVWEKPFTANSLLDAPLSSDMSVYAKFSPIHVCEFTEEVATNDYIATNATCEDKATYYYSCTCGEKGTETFESGEALGHSFTNYEFNNDAQCGIDGTETATCDNGCGESDTRTKVGSALEHDYSAWVTNNNGTHTRTCSHNNSHKETKNCNGGAATCRAKAVCIDCGAEYGSLAGHIAKEEWSTTEKYHYHACKTENCTEKLDKENHTFDKNKKCTVCDYVTTELLWTEISSDVFAIDGTNLYVKVPNKQTYFAFAETINVAEGATYKVYTDIQCKEESNIPSYMVNDLVVGNNTYYFLVNNEGSFPKIYTVTIRRRPMYDVTFIVNGGTAVDKQVIEEDDFATEPTTTKIGYTFDGWDYDFATPITSNKTITASWVANTDTKYTVIYYLQNLNDNNYTPYETIELKGTTNTTAKAEIKEYAHFTYYSYNSTISGNISPDGSRILRVYYTRDKYVISTTRNNTKAGTVTAGGTYKFDKQITLTATTNAGYTWLGWYDGETCVCEDEEFTFKAEKDVTYTATWSANTDTKYMVNYYLQNLEDDEYTLHEFVKLKGVTDTPTAEVEIKEYTHFTYNASKSTISGNINGDGGQVLSVYYTRDSYAIVVNANNAKAGTSTQINSKYKYDKQITLTATTKAGYTWLGWYEGETCVCEDEEFTFKAEKDGTYTATWETNEYSITYELNGGENHEDNPDTYTVETATITLLVPTKTGYTFNGWFMEGTFNNQVTKITLGSYGDKIFYAKWTPTEYDITYAVINTKKEITFDYNYSGGEIKKVELLLDEILNYPNEPSRNGYIFRGWFLDSACTQRFMFNEKIEGDLTLYAGWQAHNSSGYSHTNINPINYSPSSNSYSISAYGTSSSSQRYIYLVAKESGTHKIYYKNSSSSSYYYTYIGVTNVTAGKTIKSTSYCSSTSYNYVSFTCSAGDVIRINIYRYNTSSYSNYGTAYFYFEGFEKTVSTACSNGIFEYETYNIETPTFDLITPTRAGYIFDGWFTEETFENQVTEIPLGSYGDKTFYAKWTARDDTKYIVNYYLQNLDDDEYTLHEFVELKGVTDTPTAEVEIKEYTHFTYNASKSVISGNINGDGSQVLSVYYTRDTYSIVVNANNAKAGTSTQINSTYKFDKQITLTATTNVGYTWLGWYEGETCVCEDEEFTFKAEKNVTYTATWSANTDTKYTVIYYLQNLNDNNYTPHETVELTGETDTPTAEVDIKEYTHFTYNASKSVISGNINGDGSRVLSVYYTRNVYNLSINNTSAGAITNSGKYKYGSNAIESEVQCYLGYKFIGWYCGDELLSIDTRYTFTADKNVIAKFEVVSEMANFNFTSTATTCQITGVKDKTINEIIIPDYVTSVDKGAFSGCLKLESITLPFVGAELNGTSNTYFGYIFGASSSSDNDNYVPTSLKTVIITGGSRIGSYAFYGCSRLTSVTIGNSVTSINSNAFSSCKSLTSIVIPNSVTSISYDAYYGCENLTGVYITNIAAWCNISFKESTSNPLLYAENLYLNNELVTEIIIPEGVTKINSYAFCSYDNLKSIVIGNSVTSIGYYAFHDCTNLKEIVIPNSVTVIPKNAFAGSMRSQKVYYQGTAEEWLKVNIDSSNKGLTYGTMYYYTEIEPALNANGTAYDGNYWHYDTDGITPVIWVYTKPEE